MLKIQAFSKQMNVPVSTIRYYERLGILTPDFIDPSSGYAYYDATASMRVLMILGLKEIGFSLKEIKIHIHIQEDTLLYELFLSKKQALVEEQQRIATLIEEIDSYLLLYKGGS